MSKKVTRKQRIAQVVLGICVGVVVGFVCALIFNFWLWTLTGAVFGAIVGLVTTPGGPEEHVRKRR
ncbi:hypothetical protein [Canibacter zhoujuaniae]|uniref:hypothetical protein n=1 Tax=Canibacter zhoujuaniae TaxID=2708343 RepID=UPI0014247932|nr:hypothetical protein [Canibacter zhoujuaniae]